MGTGPIRLGYLTQSLITAVGLVELLDVRHRAGDLTFEYALTIFPLLLISGSILVNRFSRVGAAFLAAGLTDVTLVTINGCAWLLSGAEVDLLTYHTNHKIITFALLPVVLLCDIGVGKWVILNENAVPQGPSISNSRRHFLLVASALIGVATVAFGGIFIALLLFIGASIARRLPWTGDVLMAAGALLISIALIPEGVVLSHGIVAEHLSLTNIYSLAAVLAVLSLVIACDVVVIMGFRSGIRAEPDRA